MIPKLVDAYDGINVKLDKQAAFWNRAMDRGGARHEDENHLAAWCRVPVL